MKSLRDGSNEYFHSNQLILSPQYQTTWGMRQFLANCVHRSFLGARGVQLLGKSSVSVGVIGTFNYSCFDLLAASILKSCTQSTMKYGTFA